MDEGVVPSPRLKLICDDLGRKFRVTDVRYLTGTKAVLMVEKEDVPRIVDFMFTVLKASYSTTAAVDERSKGEGFGVYHIFSLRGLMVVIGFHVSPDDPKAPSITNVIPGANWAEREARDLLGVEFEGHPDPRRLVLPDDWPDDVYPLRKEFRYNDKSISGSVKEYPMRRPEAEECVVPIGPYHPALHEPEYFRLYVSRGRVVEAEYRGFMVSRGIEKLAEGRFTYDKVPFLAERICGICGYTHSTCYCLAAEEAAGLEVPERAQYIRMVLLELERIHSHLLWMGVACHLLGFDTGFMHCWRVRERVMDLCELITGNRKMYSMNMVGGVRRDIDEDKKRKVLKYVAAMRKELEDLVEAITSVREIITRMEGVGVLEREDAIKMCAVGPVARASGIKRDVRKDHPYLAYRRVSFEVPVYNGNDVLSRFRVRVDELIESAGIVEQALNTMPPDDELMVRGMPKEGAVGVAAVEAPRGEDVHFLMADKGGRIFRWKVRAPTYNNIPTLLYMLRGQSLADAPIIIASIDPCFSCTDRVVVMDMDSGRRRRLTARDMIRLSRRGGVV